MKSLLVMALAYILRSHNSPVTISIKNGEEHTRELTVQEQDFLKIYPTLNGQDQIKVMGLLYNLEENKEKFIVKIEGKVMFCKKCGKELEDGVQFCSSCGENMNETAPQQPTSPAYIAGKTAPPAKKKNGCLISLAIVGGIILLIILIVIAAPSSDTTDTATPPPTESPVHEQEKKTYLDDVSKFSKISSEELVKIMGEPMEREDREVGGKKHTVYKYKDKYELEFVIRNNIVTLLWVSAGDANSFSTAGYETISDVFSAFGIQKGNNAKFIEDTGGIINFENVNDSIKEVCIWDYDNSDKSFKKISFCYEEYKSSEKKETGVLTLDKFSKIENGMTYEEVTKIIGCEGEISVESGEKG
ncbi:MAG: zinc ribbon domain-containing protein, partial [Oscillospiraceae bacterium]